MSSFVADIITSFVSIYTLLIVAAVILSWVRPANSRRPWFREIVDALTIPYLRLFRRFVPPLGRLDFSPMVALIALQALGGGAAAAAANL